MRDGQSPPPVRSTSVCCSSFLSMLLCPSSLFPSFRRGIALLSSLHPSLLVLFFLVRSLALVLLALAFLAPSSAVFSAAFSAVTPLGGLFFFFFFFLFSFFVSVVPEHPHTLINSRHVQLSSSCRALTEQCALDASFVQRTRVSLRGACNSRSDVLEVKKKCGLPLKRVKNEREMNKPRPAA